MRTPPGGTAAASRTSLVTSRRVRLVTSRRARHGAARHACRPRRAGIAAAASLAAIGLGAAVGCTNAPQPPAASRASAPASPVPPAAASRPAAVPAQTPRQRAVADAAAILASFAVPPGARRLPGAPAANGGALRQPLLAAGAPSLVDQVAWWQVPGQQRQVLGWELAHLPRRFAFFNETTTDGGPGLRPMWADEFALPPVPAVLDSRILLVEVADAGGGQTAIRVDAQVTWRPPRPASEHVRSAVRARPGGPALATVGTAGACGSVLVTIGSRRQPALAGGAELDRQLLSIARLHWAGYDWGLRDWPRGGAFVL